MSPQNRTTIAMNISRGPVQMVSPKITALSLKCTTNLPVQIEELPKLWDGLNVDISHGFGIVGEDGSKVPFGQMTVSLSQEKNPGRLLPYEISASAGATFQIIDATQIPEEDQVHLAMTRGWSQLYAFVRSTIESITAQAPFGSYQLPAMQVNLTDVGALEAAINGLLREINPSPTQTSQDIADLRSRAFAIERAIQNGKGAPLIDALASKYQVLKEKLDTIKITNDS